MALTIVWRSPELSPRTYRLAIRNNLGLVELLITGEIAARYALEETDRLTPAAQWVFSRNLLMTNSTQTVEFPLPALGQRFYRVRRGP